jgi:hypothetical protein
MFLSLFWWYWGFELRALCLLGKPSIIGATPSAFFYVVVIISFQIVSPSFVRVGLYLISDIAHLHHHAWTLNVPLLLKICRTLSLESFVNQWLENNDFQYLFIFKL